LPVATSKARISLVSKERYSVRPSGETAIAAV
jgi:hypothetical protein